MVKCESFHVSPRGGCIWYVFHVRLPMFQVVFISKDEFRVVTVVFGVDPHRQSGIDVHHGQIINSNDV